MIKSAAQSSILNDTRYTSMSAGVVPSSEYLIESRVLDTAVSSVTFSDLAQYAGIYKHLQIVMVSRVDQSTARDLLMTFNGVGGTSYSGHRLLGNGSTVTSGARSSSSSMFIGFVDGDQFTAGVIDILDAYGNKNKTVRSFVGTYGFAREVMICSGLFVSTNTISSITLFPGVNNYVAGSRFSLYGVT
jgi:hypothetical protein